MDDKVVRVIDKNLDLLSYKAIITKEKIEHQINRSLLKKKVTPANFLKFNLLIG